MTNKQNDILLNILANPTFTLSDFQTVGLTAENTSLHSIEEYKNSTKITENPMLWTDGKFDENKLLKVYNYAAQQYNLLATQDYNTNVLQEAEYSKDNIWVAPEKRTLDFKPKLVRQPNEYLISNSLESIGKKGKRTLSEREIAQSQPLYNFETGEWEDSPNDSFFDNFFNTLVLATYEEDEYDLEGNLIHQKGEHKLNEDGLPYYETLGGRSVYGKQVLNKFNTLTTDGSFANRFDFFDSDDLEQKGFVPTLLKNAALVGSMFIPYVGPWITGANVAIQGSGMLATLAKIGGSDSPFVNELEGWVKSVNRSDKTDYAIENTWCMENFLDMIGDTAGQLAEQRWIFTYLPTLWGNSTATKAMRGGSEEVVKKIEKELLKKDSWSKLIDGTMDIEYLELNKQLKNLAKTKAVSYVDDLVKNASKVSGNFATAYMVGLTTLDTYGEFLNAGASKEEAALTTIGYALAEAALLSTGLGEWIMPELKGNKIKHKAIAEALSKDVVEAYQNSSTKRQLTGKLIDVGKKLFKNDYAKYVLAGEKTAKITGMHALAESFEETSEELLADFAKSCLNWSRKLRGEETLDLGEWTNMIDRYGMSALGGFFGGGLASIGTSFHQSKHLATMDKSVALQELIYLVNNGEDKKFLKDLDKMLVGNKHLSASKILYKEGDDYVYDEGTKDDNQDLEIKRLIRNDVEMIRSILKAEGALISEESLLNRLTGEDRKELLQDIRYNNLQRTSSINAFIQDFALIQRDLVVKNAELLSLQPTDKKELTEDMVKRQAELNNELTKIKVKKDAYLKGNMSKEVIRNAVYEMNPHLHIGFSNIKLFAKAVTGKNWDELSIKDQSEITEDYKKYAKSDMKADILTYAKMYWDMLTLFTPVIAKQREWVLKQSSEYRQIINKINQLVTNKPVNEDVFVEELQANVDALPSDIQKDLIGYSINENSGFWLKQSIEEIVETGYIHPEIARALLESLNNLQIKAQEQINSGNFDETTQYWIDILQEIPNLVEQIKNVKFSTPVLEYLKQFQYSVTNSETDLMKHLQTTLNVFDSNKEDLQGVLFNQEWADSNKEALRLIESFISVINGMRKDNANAFSPTGYTTILNNIYKEDDPLYELDFDEANILLEDAILIKNRLEQAQVLWDINKGRKLKEQETVAIHTNKLLSSDSAYRFVNSCIPDDWEEKEKIKALLDLNVLSNNEEISLNNEQKTLLDKQMIQLEDAIYEMFKKHGFNNLKNMITKFASINGFFQKTGKPLTQETPYFEDNAFVWWLASRAALKSSDFYGAYTKNMSDKIAPIPSQLLGVYLGVAAIANMDVLNMFQQAYKEAIIETYDKLSIDEKRRVLRNFNGAEDFAGQFDEYFPGFDAVSQFKNMIFLEGIAGSGKTFGIIQGIVNTLKSTGVIKGAWYIHATQENADSAIKDLNIEDGVGFNREKFCGRISPEWKDATLNNNNLYPESFTIENGALKNTWKLNKESNLPKVIFIDEVSRFNQQELAMISQWASENGIVVITAGDLDQSKQIAKGNIKNKSMTFTMARNQFIRIPKLGLTLRTSNRQMTQCVTSMRANVDQDVYSNSLTFLANDSSHPGIHGIYVSETLSDDVKEKIKQLFDTATEKVGFAWYSEDTELYKYLEQNYSDKIQKFKDSDAQGLEAQYYIIEPNPNDPQYLNTVYTGITRAQQGGILISDRLASKPDNLYQIESLTETDVKKSSEKKKKQLEQFISEGVIKPVDIEIKSPSKETPTITVPSVPPISSEPASSQLGNYYTTQEAAQEQLPEVGLQAINENGDIYEIVETKVIKHDEGFVPYVVIQSETDVQDLTLQQLLSDYTIQDKQQKFTQMYSGKIVLQDDTVAEVMSFNENNGTYTLSNGQVLTQNELQRVYKSQFIPEPTIIEIDPTPELITEENESSEEPSVAQVDSIPRLIHKLYTNTAFWDTIDESQLNTGRIDGIYGLINLLKIKSVNDGTLKALQESLATCRKFVQEGKISELIDLLGLQNKHNEIRYAIKCTAPNSKKIRYKIASRMSFLQKLGLNPEPTSKNLVLYIKSEGVPTIEIPIASLNNPITLMQDGSYRSDFWNVFNNAKGNEFQKLQAVIETFDNTGLPKHEQDLINLCKFYCFNSDGVFYLGYYDYKQKKYVYRDTALNFSQTGPKIIKYAGDKQFHEEMNQYNGSFVDLDIFAENPAFSISPILSSKTGYVGKDFKINPGYPFVLISDTVQEKDLATEFVNGNPRVKLFYVLPPRATVAEWVEHLHTIFNVGEKSTKYYIGNAFTAYRILSRIINTIDSSDGFTSSIKSIIQDLIDIENKWKQPNIEFSNKSIEKGKIDSQLYDEISKVRGDAKAREYCKIREQITYLKSNYEGAPPITSNKTNSYALNYFVHNLIYPNTFTDKGWVKTNEVNRQNLNILEDACRDLIITYTPKLDKDPNHQVEEFIPIQTTDKFTLFGDKKFQINGKIDTSTLTLGTMLSTTLEQLTYSKTPWKNGNYRTSYFYFDGKTWKLTSLAQTIFENDYLGIEETPVEPREVSVIDVAKEKNRLNKRQYSFVHQGRLLQVDLPNEIELINPEVDFDSNPRITVTATNNISYNLVVDGKVIKATYNIPKTVSPEPSNISEEEFQAFLKDLENKRPKRGPVSKKLKYIETAENVLQAIEIIKSQDLTNVKFDLEWLQNKGELQTNTESFINKMLNYVKNLETQTINEQNSTDMNKQDNECITLKWTIK